MTGQPRDRGPWHLAWEVPRGSLPLSGGSLRLHTVWRARVRSRNEPVQISQLLKEMNSKPRLQRSRAACADWSGRLRGERVLEAARRPRRRKYKAAGSLRGGRVLCLSDSSGCATLIRTTDLNPTSVSLAAFGFLDIFNVCS